MLLLIDAGNSYLKWNIASETHKQLVATTTCVDWKNNDLLSQTVSAWKEHDDIAQVIMSSVVDDGRNRFIYQWINDVSGIELVLVRSQRSALGVTNAYLDPAHLGVDRWVALIACADLFPKENCIVVDCGTAITVDTLYANGKHKGGMIFPGIQLMKNSLLRNTDIKSTGIKGSREINKEIKIFNQTTDTAIENGVLNSVIAGIAWSVSKIAKTCNENVRIIVTGGGAPYVLPHLSKHYHHEPDLIMKGLLALAVNT